MFTDFQPVGLVLVLVLYYSSVTLIDIHLICIYFHHALVQLNYHLGGMPLSLIPTLYGAF